MEEPEKELSEILKNLDKTKLFKRQTYIELFINEQLYQAYILNEMNDNRYEVFIPNLGQNCKIQSDDFYFFGENECPDENKFRKLLINIELNNLEIQKIINILQNQLKNFNITVNSESNNVTNSTDKTNNIENTNSNLIIKNNFDIKKNIFEIPDKNGKIVDATGYSLYQFLEGYIIDYLYIICNAFNRKKYSKSHLILFSMILDLIIYMGKIVKENISKYKGAYYNRKLLVLSPIYAILISFDSLIYNLTPLYRYYYSSKDVDQRLTNLSNLLYSIVLSTKNGKRIPFNSLTIFIKVLSFQKVKDRIENYDHQQLYQKLNEHMGNLDKNELINNKKDTRKICNELVYNLFDNNMDNSMNETFYNYLLSCLKCSNLEQKMRALNDISDLINKFDENRKINSAFKDFIENNNILDIFFEDSIHDEVIKRSFNLFKYLAKFDCLKESIIEKIIQRQSNNELMKKLLMEIISELPKEKKNILFNRLTQGIKFDDENTNNIEYISKLTESCLSISNLKRNDKDKEENKDNEDIIEIEDETKDNNYYGLNMILDYIIKDFNEKKRYDENNVDVAINSFEHIINTIFNSGIFKINDVMVFLEKLIDNIKNNTKKNSIIQSIKLIHKLFIILAKKKYRNIFIENLKNLDEKYDIITLIINDLIRYMKLLPKDYSNSNGKNNIYEGIYPHYINVETRLNLIFFFFKSNFNNYGLILEGKKHLEKIYEIFKCKQFNEERKKFYEIITKNINQIENTILVEFYQDILLNKEEFDVKEINDNASINLVIQFFQNINYNNKSIFNDGRKIRVGEGASIEGIDMLFDLLTQNPIDIIQEKVSQLLCDICLSHKNYNSVKISDYWRNYFDKINLYLDSIINTNDSIALNGIIKLINNIYTTSCDCYGKIPSKNDFKNSNDFKFYHFSKVNSKSETKLKCGREDRLINMRYKIAYYFNIPVNNVAFIDLDGKIYTLNDDFEIFTRIFCSKKYFYEREYECLQFKEIPFRLLEIKDNPKFLIETNDKLYNILINNLKMNKKTENGSDDNEINKKKIWNFISKLPKDYYFKNKIQKLGQNTKIDENEIKNIFDINEIYLLTYSLQSIYYILDNNNCNNNIEDNGINDKEDDETNDNRKPATDNEEFLDNFIIIQNGDKLIIDILLILKIEHNNIQPIQIDCFTILIKALKCIEKHKENKKGEENDNDNILNDQQLYNKVLQKITLIISQLLKYDSNNIFLDESDFTEDNIEEKREKNNKIINLVEYIFSFIDEISKNRTSYMTFIFSDKNIFIDMFIKDFILCKNENLKILVEQYMSENYTKNNENIKKYLEIILTVEVFNYLVKNDISGKYFTIISQILKKDFVRKEKKENNESSFAIETNIIQQSKLIIDLTLNYIQEECNKDEEKEKQENEKKDEIELKETYENKEKFKEGLILFLSNLLYLNTTELINYITTKVDIFDFFISKCIVRKCTPKPLESKSPFCLNDKSKEAVYKLLLNIIQNIKIEDEKDNNLYLKMLDIFDNLNKIGFWKSFHDKNWNVEAITLQKGKFVGLKNMASTCYLNSIIQQLFMIPIFRETILKIENPYKDNVLYELQLLFSALKVYEFSYYSPKSFVLANKLNFYEQMDADEFYGSLIDKIENDIKKIYDKKTKEEDCKMEEEVEKENENKKNAFEYKNIFNYFFGIKVLDELTFVDCGHKRYNEFCYNNIQLEIKGFSNIYDSLKNYFRTEVMDGDNKIICEQCNAKRTCNKHLILKTLPNILVISLKRFEFDYNTMTKFKLNKYFEFPLELDLKDYLIENHIEKNTNYELIGITIHLGVSDYGHYFDIIKGPDKWYKFNDTYVNEFPEEDISREAFGEKEESSDDESDKEKERGKKNAYILIYSKKDNPMYKMENPLLAFPPYNQYSNVRNDFIEIINKKLFKSYMIQNLFSYTYHNFVLGLLKMDVAKIININLDLEQRHQQFAKILKNEGYMKNLKNNNEAKTKINNNNNEHIFQFAVRFYFNIILRLMRKTQDKSILNNFGNFKEILLIYVQSDINKAKYILEEFSNPKALDEYLIYCPNNSSVDNCIEIIISALNKFFKDYNNINNENSIVYKFLNTLMTYISKNIREVNLENVNKIFYEIINKNAQKFLNHLKRKNITKWIKIFYKKVNEQEIIDSVFNETNLPTLHSNHAILSEKNNFVDENNNRGGDENDSDESGYPKPKNDESDIYDRQFLNVLRDMKANEILLRELSKNIN